MRKIGMVVAAAAVVSYAGAARAQTTTEQIINATATIDSVLSLTANDADFDCGTVFGFGTVSATCPGDGTGDPDAQVEIDANQNWVLAVTDTVVTGDECDDIGVSSTASNQVTLCNDDLGATGDFVIALDYANGCTESTIPTDGDSVAGTSAEDCTVDIIEEATGDSISGLDSHDGFGVYNGTFTVTLSAAP